MPQLYLVSSVLDGQLAHYKLARSRFVRRAVVLFAELTTREELIDSETRMCA